MLVAPILVLTTLVVVISVMVVVVVMVVISSGSDRNGSISGDHDGADRGLIGPFSPAFRWLFFLSPIG